MSNLQAGFSVLDVLTGVFPHNGGYPFIFWIVDKFLKKVRPYKTAGTIDNDPFHDWIVSFSLSESAFPILSESAFPILSPT